MTELWLMRCKQKCQVLYPERILKRGQTLPLPFLSLGCLEHNMMAGAAAAPSDHEYGATFMGCGASGLGRLSW